MGVFAVLVILFLTEIKSFFQILAGWTCLFAILFLVMAFIRYEGLYNWKWNYNNYLESVTLKYILKDKIEGEERFQHIKEMKKRIEEERNNIKINLIVMAIFLGLAIIFYLLYRKFS